MTANGSTRKAARPTDAQGENTNAYTCPVFWQNAKEPCLVVAGCDYITGHRLEDGGELWRLHIDAKGNRNIRVIGFLLLLRPLYHAVISRTPI